MLTHTDVEASWLAETVRLATENVAKGGGPFGALVASRTDIVATGINRVTATLDPTAHAEVTAIRAACQELGTFSLEGCVLVSSCEPCPMCLSSALWARVDRVVYASDRDDAAKAGFDDAFLYDEMPKPPTERQIPMRRIALTEADDVFQAWIDKPDKIAY